MSADSCNLMGGIGVGIVLGDPLELTRLPAPVKVHSSNIAVLRRQLPRSLAGNTELAAVTVCEAVGESERSKHVIATVGDMHIQNSESV